MDLMVLRKAKKKEKQAKRRLQKALPKGKKKFGFRLLSKGHRKRSAKIFRKVSRF